MNSNEGAGILKNCPALTSGCVAGVRRAEVLRTAQMQGVECREGLFQQAELLAANAVFTANVAAVRVIQKISNQYFGDMPAPWTALLHEF